MDTCVNILCLVLALAVVYSCACRLNVLEPGRHQWWAFVLYWGLAIWASSIALYALDGLGLPIPGIPDGDARDYDIAGLVAVLASLWGTKDKWHKSGPQSIWKPSQLWRRHYED